MSAFIWRRDTPDMLCCLSVCLYLTGTHPQFPKPAHRAASSIATYSILKRVQCSADFECHSTWALISRGGKGSIVTCVLSNQYYTVTIQAFVASLALKKSYCRGCYGLH